MAINSLYSTTRLTGMVSNMDTDSIIQQMMKVSQLKIDSKNRSKTMLQWKQQSLNGIKNEIEDFRKTFLRSSGSQNMRTTSTYNSTVATLSGKNADAVSVTTNLYSSTGTMTIGRIESLAKGASVSSGTGVSADGNGYSASTKLGAMVFAGEQQLQFDENGETKITVGNGTNEKEITLSANDTIESMMKKVNSSGAGVTMSYDRLSDKFKIESNTTGRNSDVRLSGEGNALSLFGLDGAVSEGKSAVVNINGERVERDTNTFDYRGVKITLNRTTGANEEDTTVTLKRDVTQAMDRIKSFVSSYNTLIKKLEGLLKESKTSAEKTYTPRTEEELSAMTEKQIEEWNTIAKKGLLKGDTGIQSMTNALRGALFDAVEGVGLSPSEIGISTGSYFDGTGGQIVINEDKLKAALEKDPEQVMSVFMQSYDTDVTDASTKYKQNGLMNRIDKIMGDYAGIGGSQSRSLESLAESLKQANEQIDKITKKMYEEEEKLYKKFAAMETALSKMQSQTSSLTSMLGMG